MITISDFQESKNDWSPTRRLKFIIFQNRKQNGFLSRSIKSTHKQKVARVCGDVNSFFYSFKQTSFGHFVFLKRFNHFLIASSESELSL